MTEETYATVDPPPRGEDLPSEDGIPMETLKHRVQMELLIESLDSAWADRPLFVGGNMFFYYSELQSKRNDFRGPDVLVVLDAEERERKSWVVWEEGGRCPDVIIELTSDSTRDVDHGPKKALYARLRVPEYFIFDPESGALEGFILDVASRGYVPLTPDARGWLPARTLGLWLGVVAEGRHRRLGGPWLRWFDAEGRMLPTDLERVAAESERAAAESERAAAESERAAAESERARALEAEVAALKRRLAAHEPER